MVRTIVLVVYQGLYGIRTTLAWIIHEVDILALKNTVIPSEVEESLFHRKTFFGLDHRSLDTVR